MSSVFLPLYREPRRCKNRSGSPASPSPVRRLHRRRPYTGVLFPFSFSSSDLSPISSSCWTSPRSVIFYPRRKPTCRSTSRRRRASWTWTPSQSFPIIPFSPYYRRPRPTPPRPPSQGPRAARRTSRGRRRPRWCRRYAALHTATSFFRLPCGSTCTDDPCRFYCNGASTPSSWSSSQDSYPLHAHPRHLSDYRRHHRRHPRQWARHTL